MMKLSLSSPACSQLMTGRGACVVISCWVMMRSGTSLISKQRSVNWRQSVSSQTKQRCARWDKKWLNESIDARFPSRGGRVGSQQWWIKHRDPFSPNDEEMREKERRHEPYFPKSSCSTCLFFHVLLRQLQFPLLLLFLCLLALMAW